MKIIKNNFIILAIISLAAFVRFYKISDYMTFLGDEGRDVLVAYNILHGKLTLLGPTSSVGGFFLGPIYYYFISPFLWLFNYDPVGPAVMVGLFGVATVYLIYRIGSIFFNRQVGLISALLYSISPVVIAYSRSSWNPNLLPFFSILIIYFLYKASINNSGKLFFITGLLLGIGIQLHYIITFLGFTVFLYIFFINIFINKSKSYIFLLKKLLSQNLYIFGGFIISISPFLLFEVRHNFLNIQSIYKFIFHSSGTGVSNHFVQTIGNVLFRLFSRLITAFPPPEQVNIATNSYLAFWFYFTIMLIIASLGLFLYQYSKTIQKRNEAFLKMSIILIWGTVGILLFGFYNKPIYDYYFQFMFPLPFFLVGNLIYVIWSKSLIPFNFNKKRFIEKIFALIIFSVLFYLNISGMPFRFLANKQKDQVERIADFVISKTNNKSFNFALISQGNSDHGYRYFFEIINHRPVVIENFQNDLQRHTVTDQLLVICEQSCSPLGSSLWEIAGFGRAEIAEKWDFSVVSIYKLVHYIEK
ncbi:MAG: glycosyltransferase family 39 protein [Candidatus Levybacteria bacterium]|nr:glycosyltransferase family 39 protein [Candidatus Levybacteria bacterium]